MHIFIPPSALAWGVVGAICLTILSMPVSFVIVFFSEVAAQGAGWFDTTKKLWIGAIPLGFLVGAFTSIYGWVTILSTLVLLVLVYLMWLVASRTRLL